MGVRGLLTFAQSLAKVDCFENAHLKDTPLVIDGSNLRYLLHAKMKKRNCAYGGEYSLYYQTVADFFACLKEHGVNPIVILDGSHEVMKRDTLWSRSKSQLENALSCNPLTQGSMSIMPIFARDIFIEAVKSVKVKITQTYGEADREIAHLASRVLKCPVLSNDSDFLIFPSVDLIELKSLDVDNADPDYGIRCRRFNRRAFLQCFGLQTDKLLPLCATLMGNDDTGNQQKLTSVKDRIFSQVKLDKVGRNVSYRKRLMSSILKRLGREKDGDIVTALDKLLQAVPAGKSREDARQLVLQSAMSYCFTSTSEDCLAGACDCIPQKWTSSVNELSIKSQIESCYLPYWCLDIIRHGLFFFPSQVEDGSEKSAISICRPILRTICELLRPNEGCDEVKFVSRVQGKKVTQNDLSDVTPIITEDKNILEFVLQFWCQNSDVAACELATVIAFLLNLLTFDSNESHDEKHDIAVIHSLANFQAVFYFAAQLWKLKKEDISLVKLMKTWSGLKIYKHIAHYSNVHELESFVDKNASLKAYYDKYSHLASSRDVAREETRRRRRERKKLAKAKVEAENSSDEANDNDDDSADLLALASNKFAVLSLGVD